MNETTKKRTIKRRGILKSGLSRIEKFVETELQNADNALIQTKINRLREYNEEFQTVQSELEINDETDEDNHYAYREEFEDLYDILLAKLQAAVDPTIISREDSDNQSNASSMNCQRSNIRLPKINLPNFDGNLTTWLHFKDTFENLVIANKELSDIERFHYLLSSLKGEAKDTIKNISISNSNFSVAYDSIKSRYHCPKLISSEYVKKLIQTPTKLSYTETDLRQLINNFQGNLAALEVLHVQPSILDLILSELLLSSVDRKIRMEFENKFSNQDAICFKDVTKFLEKKCQTLQLCTATSNAKLQNPWESRKLQKNNDVKKQHQSYVSTSVQCPMCNDTHKLYTCPQFIQASVSDKYKIVKDNNICSNCLSLTHKWKSCNSKMSCKRCHKYHHTLLHDDTRGSPQRQEQEGSQQSSYHSIKEQPTYQILLSTALVRVKDSNGNMQIFRAVLDSGSQINFISEKAVQQLHLKKSKHHTILQGFGELKSHSDASVNIKVHSMINDYHFDINCIILPKITGNLPALQICSDKWNLPDNISLADPSFNVPQRTDLLIGAAIFMKLLKMEQRSRPGNYPVLQNTQLGWILSGSYQQSVKQHGAQSTESFFLRNDTILEGQIQKFWNLEEVNGVIHSHQEMECEQHFQEHTKREESGTYIVSLPFKRDHQLLGNSKEMAVQRFHLLEKRLQRDKDLRQEYTQFLREYEDLGHMIQVDNTWNQQKIIPYYIPHHPVFKRTSTTTKTRVVFDASAKTDNGLSLNDILLVGPTIQDDLFSIILRFRTKQIAFSADIEKMYRQIKINSQDYNFQRIFWREDPADSLKEYALTTVTYGTAAAPFLATRCLRQLATDEEKQFPTATTVLNRDFYVDDCMSGADTIEEAQVLRLRLQELLRSGGFILRKWCSNSQELLKSINPELRETTHSLTNSGSEIVRTLGLIWKPSTDEFQIANNSTSCKSLQINKITKRYVLSKITAIFDPIGFLAPIIILCKIFMQQLWQEKSNWDDPLPVRLHNEWKILLNQLQIIPQIRIPRIVLIKNPVTIQLHGFSDASQRAFGCCIYIRSTNNEGKIITKLFCAKSRVAPLKQISLPRLELSGALLLTQLMKKTAANINLNITGIYMWTDSMLVLNWLASCPSKWKTFVANRVSEIQETAPARIWHHVPSQSNPADLVSRGLNPKAIISNSFWWNGPQWLSQEYKNWPKKEPIICNNDLTEQRKGIVLSITVIEDGFINKFSNLLKLQRITAYCLRFLSNCRKPPQERNVDELSPSELDTALKKCIKITQAIAYNKEISQLKEGRQVNASSNIKNLNPILDQNNYLRVGGRLLNAPLPYEVRHQVILPPHHHLTRLIIMSEHKRLLHAGHHLLISSIRQKYWIPSIRQIIRKCLYSCLICRKLSATMAKQLMGNLPKERVTPCRPFTNVGLDFAGHFLIKTGTKRSKTFSKCYIALFICLATKALHIEVVSDLTTGAFLASLRRFIARRGYPSNIFSDNGTNFTGANRKIQITISDLQKKELVNATAPLGLKWHFIPPYSPHFGGLWEAAVKSLKYHLRRVMGTTSLTFEELTTLTTQIEACLNSRPLIRTNDNSSDPPYLTPAHFLVGEPLTSLPEFDYT